MATSKIAGYKKVFGLVLPDWVDERVLNMVIGYVLVSVVMMFVLLLVVNPNFENVKKLESRQKAESERLSVMRESKRSLDRLIEDVSPTQQAAVFRAMPIEYSPEEAVFSFRRIANEVRVSIVEYSLPAGVIYEEGAVEFTGGSSTDKTTSIDFKNFIIQITVEGEIDNILDFIDKVQTALPIAFVSDLSIQEVVKASELRSARSNVNLKLAVQYYQPQLKSFNLSGLQSFSEREVALMNELETYANVSFPANIEAATSSGTVGAVRDLFVE